MARTKSSYTKTGEKRSKGEVAKAPRNSTSSKKATKAFILKNAVVKRDIPDWQKPITGFMKKDDKGKLVESKPEPMILDEYCKEPEEETSDIHKPGGSGSSKNQEMVHMEADQIESAIEDESDIEDESANGDETENGDESTDSVAENIEQECVLINLCTSDEEEDKNSFAEDFQGNREAVPAEAKFKENLVSEDNKAKEVVAATDEQEENILTNDDEKEVVPAKDEQEENIITNEDKQKEVVPEKDEQEENIITNEDKEKEAVPAEAEFEDDKENKFGVKPKKEASCNGDEVVDTVSQEVVDVE